MLFRRILTVLTVASTSLIIAGAALSEPVSSSVKGDLVFVKIDIHSIGPTKLANLKKNIVHRLSIEADMDLILLTTKEEAAKHAAKLTVLDIEPIEDQLFVIQKAHAPTGKKIFSIIFSAHFPFPIGGKASTRI